MSWYDENLLNDLEPFYAGELSYFGQSPDRIPPRPRCFRCMQQTTTPRCSSARCMGSGIFDPGSATLQFRPGQRITVFLPDVPGGQITGTFIRFIPPDTAEIQLDDGSVRLVDIAKISSAGTAPLPSGGGMGPGGGTTCQWQFVGGRWICI